jgi:hypothetical protein
MTSPVDLSRLLGVPPDGCLQSIPAAAPENLTPGLLLLLDILRLHPVASPANSGCLRDLLDLVRVDSARIEDSVRDICMIQTLIRLLDLGNALDILNLQSHAGPAAARIQATHVGPLTRKIAQVIMKSPLLAPTGFEAERFPGLCFLRAELTKEVHMGLTGATLHKHIACCGPGTAAAVEQLTLLLYQALDVS